MLKDALKKLHSIVLKCLTVIIVALFCAQIFSRFTAKGADNYERMYALRVETGEFCVPKDIGSFVVVYRDTDKNIRRSYINPYDGDYAASLKLAYNSGVSEKVKARTDDIGYTASWFGSNPNYDNATPLAPNSTDTYFFKTYYDVEEIVSIGIMTGDSDTVGKRWTCNGISLYKVNNIQGIVPWGFISNKFELGFEGTLIERFVYENGPTNNSIAATINFSNQKNGILYLYNDASNPTSLGASTKGYLVKESANYSNLSPDNDIYTIKIDIADVYKAGFEGYVAKEREKAKLRTNNSSGINPAEVLILNIDYITNTNSLRSVNMPVVLSSLGYAIENKVITKDTELADILGQGSSLAFTAYLPDFQKIHYACIKYVSPAGDSSVKALTGYTSKSAVQSQHESYYKTMNRDQISIAGVQIYKGDNAVELSMDDTASLKVKVKNNAKPLFSTNISTLSGQLVNSGGALTLKFFDTPKKVVDKRNLFIFEAKTTNIPNAGTTSDITAVIKYLDNEDNEKQYDFRFAEAAKNFYGYWPDEDGEDAGYELCMQSGSTYHALLEIESAKQIVGITLENRGKDDWMAESVSIYHVDDNSKIGKICYYWNDGKDKAKVIHGREVSGQVLKYNTDLMAVATASPNSGVSLLSTIGGSSDDPNAAAGIYLGVSRSRDINFTSSEIGEQKDNTTNIFEYIKEMPFEIATTNFGFDARRVAYTVNVKVASLPYGSIEDGNRYDDCGSFNYFYFQLKFENGTSAYVQANQQMVSDGFRSGVTETFRIYVNQDYGELQSINIIPEVDINNGKPYDKLNIDNIRVVRRTPNGLSQTYVFNDIGWIGIDYSDNGGAVKYHRAEEITKSYPVSTVENTASLLFTFTYGSIPEKFSQFKGTVTAAITYKKTDGTTEIANLDMVQAMHEFNGTLKAAKTSSDRTTKDGKDKLYESDPNLMFRSNHNDRFIWEAPNIKYVESIDLELFNITGKKVDLNITNVSMTVLNNANIEDNRTINKAGEYILESRSNNEANTIISVDEKCQLGGLDNQTAGYLKVNFDNDEGTCISSNDTNKLPLIVKREPETQLDTLNIYAYVSKTKEDLNNFTVEGVIEYTDKPGSTHEPKVLFRPTRIPDENGDMCDAYCVEDLLAKNFNSLMGVTLSATGDGGYLAIDYIIIQHVKNNVVVESIKATYKTSPASIKNQSVRAEMYSKYEDVTGYQEITVQFGDKMPSDTLIPEQKDLAISIDYLFGNTGKEYSTENIFISDSYIREIHPGDCVKLKTHFANIGQIKGISLTSAQYLNVNVKSVSIGVYVPNEQEGSGEISYNCTDWYSFDCNSTFTNEKKRFKVTDDHFDGESTWSPITMKIKTLSSYAADNGSFGSNLGLEQDNKLKMVIAYENDGKLSEVKFDNIVNLINRGDFSAGNTAEISFLAKNLRSDNIKRVSFMPYDDDEESNIFWGLDSFSIAFGDGNPNSKVINTEVRKVFYEENKLSNVSFTKVTMSAEVSLVDATFSDEDTSLVVSSSEIGSLGVIKPDSSSKIVRFDHSSKDVFKIDVKLSGSNLGYNVKTGTAVTQYKSDDDALYLSVDGNVTDSSTVKLVSVENDECFLEITFDIKSLKHETVADPDNPENPEDSETPENPETPDETEVSGA